LVPLAGIEPARFNLRKSERLTGSVKPERAASGVVELILIWGIYQTALPYSLSVATGFLRALAALRRSTGRPFPYGRQ
jgi:hypothetical protein